jgi:hypothetical protein
MLDLLLLRTKEGGLDVLLDSQKKRFKSTEIIDICVELDTKWKDSKKPQKLRLTYNYLKFSQILERQKADTLGMHYNSNLKKVAERKKASKGQDPCTVRHQIKKFILLIILF